MPSGPIAGLSEIRKCGQGRFIFTTTVLGPDASALSTNLRKSPAVPPAVFFSDAPSLMVKATSSAVTGDPLLNLMPSLSWKVQVSRSGDDSQEAAMP